MLAYGQACTSCDRELYALRRNNKNRWVPILYHFRQPLANFCSGKGSYYIITERF